MNWCTDVILRTERFQLTPIRSEDVGFIHQLYSDWDVAKNLNKIPFPFDLEDARKHVDDLLSEANASITATFLIRLHAQDEYVGLVCLHHGQDHPEDRIGVLGYSICRPYWEKGYATEAARKVVAYAERRSFSRLQASTVASNIASRRLLERLDFSLVEEGFMEEPLYGPPREMVRFIRESQVMSEQD
jgi:8-oxo-dGTP diphosphatase